MKFKQETSAGGIVYKKEGNNVLWLITQHSQYKGWSFPKGLVGDKIRNESKEDAALREVKEEAGVDAKIVNPDAITSEYMYRFGEYLIKKKVYFYVMEYVSGDTKDHDFETSDVQFVDKNKVMELLTFKNDKDNFTKVINRL